MTRGKTSLYIGQALRCLLDERPEDKGMWTRSGLINTIASRYTELVRCAMPTLAYAEWCAVLDVLNGTMLQSDAASEAGLLTSVWASIYDADRLDGLGQKWGIDGQALAERIRDMDYPHVVALVDAAERWWAVDRLELTREALAAIVGAEHVA